jgi:hypothetical protein
LLRLRRHADGIVANAIADGGQHLLLRLVLPLELPLALLLQCRLSARHGRHQRRLPGDLPLELHDSGIHRHRHGRVGVGATTISRCW